MPKLVDLTDKKFGRWTVIGRGNDYLRGHPQWICKCECGKSGLVRGSILKDGGSKSCGCLNIDVHRKVCIDRNTTHGLSGTKAHNTWVNIRQRCENKNIAAYKKYGAKGIKVCDRWQSFDNFLADMGNPPDSKYTIDRIDPRGDYEPSNCRWATQKQQQNNRGNNRLVTINGETKTLMQWSEFFGIDRKKVKRLYCLS